VGCRKGEQLADKRQACKGHPEDPFFRGASMVGGQPVEYDGDSDFVTGSS